MKMLYNYTIEEFITHVLPFKHSEYRKACEDNAMKMEYAYQSFISDQCTNYIKKLQDKRIIAKKKMRYAMKELTKDLVVLKNERVL